MGRTQFRGVEQAMKMADDAPGARQSFVRVLERRNEIDPGRGSSGSRQYFDLSAILRKQQIDRWRYVFDFDRGKARQPGKIQQRI